MIGLTPFIVCANYTMRRFIKHTQPIVKEWHTPFHGGVVLSPWALESYSVWICVPYFLECFSPLNCSCIDSPAHVEQNKAHPWRVLACTCAMIGLQYFYRNGQLRGQPCTLYQAWRGGSWCHSSDLCWDSHTPSGHQWRHWSFASDEEFEDDDTVVDDK